MNKNIDDNDFPKYVLFTAKGTFTRGGVFNTHNLHMRQNENPHVVHQSHHHEHRFSVNVLAGIIGSDLAGPYLPPTRLTGDLYEVYLRQVLLELLDDVPLCIDVACGSRRTALRRIAQGTYFSKHTNRTLWASAMANEVSRFGRFDFYLWGHMKSLICETPVE